MLALIGLRCSGKTSVGRALGARLGVSCLDLDEVTLECVRAASMAEPSAGALIAARGEEAFRAIEARVLERILALPHPFVLATGGGVVERESNRTALRARALCVHLDAPDAVLVERLERERAVRPALLAGESAAQEVPRLRQRRAVHFAELAAFALDGGCEGVEQVAARLAARIELVAGVGFRAR
ncbi:MAG TPA: shikimate kinase [Planctomycetota bacterium]|nr:shikimate kinase [Planctomycetota bacterium]